MRNLTLLLGFVVLSIPTFSQTSSSHTSAALYAYSEEVKPFLLKIAEEQFADLEDNEQYVIARYNALLVDTMVVSDKVKEAMVEMEEKALADRDLITMMVEQQYRIIYVGLPKEFYEGARRRLGSE